MLENHDENWISNGYNHQARYTNLAPGNYRFFGQSRKVMMVFGQKNQWLSGSVFCLLGILAKAKICYV
jgi:hypothetical protein